MDYSEFMFLLTGGVGLENKLANPAPNWLSDKAWDEICRMCDLKGFQVERESVCMEFNLQLSSVCNVLNYLWLLSMW